MTHSFQLLVAILVVAGPFPAAVIRLKGAERATTGPAARLIAGAFTVLFFGQTGVVAVSASVPSYEPYANTMHHGTPAWSSDDSELYLKAATLSSMTKTKPN